MKLFNTKIIFSTLFVASVLAATASQAAENPAKSTNVKAALIENCKEQTSKGGKLSATEVNKFCGCQIDVQGKMTEAQKWEIQSAINSKKNPSSLPFMQKQYKELQTCLGAPLVSKLEKLTEEAMKAAQQKAAKK